MKAKWRTVRVDEIADVLGGRQLSSPRAKGELRPYLRVANVLDGSIDASNVKSMRMTDAEFETFRLRPGDVLLNEGQSLELVGRTAVYLGEPAGCAFQNSLIRLRAREGVDGAFLEYLMRYQYESRQFARISTRTTSIAHLGVGRVAGLRVRVPEVAVQQVIARLLGSTSAWIAGLVELRAAKEELMRGLMRALLTGRRPGNRPRGEKRRSVRLGDAFKERDETGWDQLPLLAITGDRGVIPRNELIRRDSSARDKSAYKRIAPGDIGYNTMRMWQGVSGLSAIEGIVSPAYTVVTPRHDVILASFAAHLLKYPPVIHKFLRLSQGLVADTLNLKFPVFAQVAVELPAIPVQREIAGVLDAAMREVRVLTETEKALYALRRGLMDRFLGGKE